VFEVRDIPEGIVQSVTVTEQAKNSFVCRFISKGGTEKKPVIVAIMPEQKRCEIRNVLRGRL
jgi:hypothetical protein